jgi:hypothetical protein
VIAFVPSGQTQVSILLIVPVPCSSRPSTIQGPVYLIAELAAEIILKEKKGSVRHTIMSLISVWNLRFLSGFLGSHREL